MEDVYGGTYRLFDKVLKRYGLSFSAVDAGDLAAVERAISPATKLVWLESPTNPLLRVVDIDAVSEVAHSRGAMVCVDNTFATPFLQQPLRLGADLVVHSSTKYIGGHSDVVGGAIMTLSLIHISEPTRLGMISYAVFCLKKKKKKKYKKKTEFIYKCYSKYNNKKKKI